MNSRRRPVHTEFIERTYEISGDLIPMEVRRVLLLEDDDKLAETIKDLLSARHYVVDRVQNGAEGLKLILAEDYHAILCDMVMPEFPGDMFYVAVKRVKPHLCRRFVFMTGQRADARIVRFLEEIKGVVLWKPFEFKKLFNVIDFASRNVGSGD
jgi:DNA-binding response OmpR family regulator